MTTPFPVFPTNTGGAVRTMNIANCLTELGHEIILLAARTASAGAHSTNIKLSQYRSLGVAGHFYNPYFLKRFKAELQESIDLIIVEYPFHSWMVASLAGEHGIPLVYDAHNVEADRFARMGKILVSKLVGKAEENICKHADLILAVSEDDQRLFLK